LLGQRGGRDHRRGHPRPEEALCDGPQQIPADEFGEFAREVTELVALMGKQVG
jgi:3-deoxy-D-arabino-heptulosonate 7-phosphate (DAHP) synthase